MKYNLTLGFDDGLEVDALDIDGLRFIKVTPIDDDAEWDMTSSIYEWHDDKLVLVAPPSDSRSSITSSTDSRSSVASEFECESPF